MESLPKPNTQALSWFYGENKKGTLVLTPKYQRNPIWSLGQKCFLIDSLISGCPIPQVFINVRTEGSTRDRKTIYEVVDGQQRLRAILEFMDDSWALVATAAKAYPVSDAYKPHISKKYSELPTHLQEAIWNYQLAVQELRGWDERQIRALFRRLNYVVEKLNKQELRHSQYFGEFVEAVEALAKEAFWDDIGIFTRRDSERMKDVEFVSELFVVVIEGVQDGQTSLDQFYADYDVSFPKKSSHMGRFRQVLKSLETVASLLKTTRFGKRADFYGLFSAAASLVAEKGQAVDLTKSASALKRLAKALDRPTETLKGVPAEYYATVIEGPNKLPKRQKRREILLSLLAGASK